jgi:hypothetical protein
VTGVQTCALPIWSFFKFNTKGWENNKKKAVEICDKRLHVTINHNVADALLLCLYLEDAVLGGGSGTGGLATGFEIQKKTTNSEGSVFGIQSSWKLAPELEA